MTAMSMRDGGSSIADSSRTSRRCGIGSSPAESRGLGIRSNRHDYLGGYLIILCWAVPSRSPSVVGDIEIDRCGIYYWRACVQFDGCFRSPTTRVARDTEGPTLQQQTRHTRTI
jgi:hypothetical protein